MRRHRLVKERKSRNWTQADVAKKLKITTSFYGMLEQGSRNPRLPLAFSLERLFGTPVADLFPDLFYAQKPNIVLGHQEQTSISEAVNQ
ncbi:MAG: helix-turn-helix transcriptional regulator [Peptococcia bacterium]|jgi:putative transcriptional regulator